ncbi:MAG: hypothetical protein ACREMQ_18550 [Longimicrobiales bacterium]
MSDADLIRFLDGEVDGAERESLAARIAADSAATRRLESLRTRTDDLSGWLRDLGPDERDISSAARVIRPSVGHSNANRTAWRHVIASTPPLLRAAAIVLLFASAALAVPPARAWMLDTFKRFASTLGTGQPVQTNDAPSIVPEPTPDISYRFAVRSDTFVVRVTGRLAGRLMLETTMAEQASAEVRGGPGAGLILLPGGVQFESAAEPGAVFDVKLPPRVRIVRVRIDGQPDVGFDVTQQAEWKQVIELRR